MPHREWKRKWKLLQYSRVYIGVISNGQENAILGLYKRRLLFSTWALCGIFNPRPLISFALYLNLCCTLTESPDLIHHVGICAGLLLQRELWPISFNPLPVSSSQRNPQPRCKNLKAPSPLLSYVNRCGCSYRGITGSKMVEGAANFVGLVHDIAHMPGSISYFLS